jgi:hypothetical protein
MINVKTLSAALLAGGLLFASQQSAQAHCDSIDGGVRQAMHGAAGHEHKD